jgi:eukaryotic-like serine/threonine-protein kinase
MSATPATAEPSVRKLGRFGLRQLLGRSAHSMAWRAVDPRSGQELLLVLPRQQPTDHAALTAWLEQARRGARLSHPNLAHAVEVGEQERWPYVAYDSAIGPTLAERPVAREGEAAADIARWIVQALSGLAFAHDAGVAHHDLQPFLLTLADNGTLRVLGLEVAASEQGHLSPPVDTAEFNDRLRRSRSAAERDVLALGIVMHGLLTGAPALEVTDVASVIARLPPHGRETLRLPWDLPRPVPEALRVIANRATDRQPRQRYRNARTLARAIEGWLEADSNQGQDAHAQLIERVRQIGALPALPGAAARAARLALMEREHTEELAQVVLRDPALSFELLRAVNSAQVRGTQVSGNGPVLTVRRAIAMVGLDGVRRSALGLRHWPGPLDEAGAHDLQDMVGQALRAARVAQSLRPAGYDAEVVSLVALMQNLGRLVVQYHFADEMRQVRRLMQPPPPEADDTPDAPIGAGMSEQAAAFAVLGADIEGMGAAVARWWGMDDAVLHMIRRLPTQLPVRHADGDDDVLRTVASAANEAVDALALPTSQQPAAIERVAQRYARALAITPRDIQAALQGSAGGGAAPPANTHASADAAVDESDDDNDNDDTQAVA